MKSKIEVLIRLHKIIKRHKAAHVRQLTEKTPHNCVYNYLHTEISQSRVRESEYPISPRRSNSLVVIQDPRPIRVCTYGSDMPDSWNGTICDDISVSAPCQFFSSIKSAEEAGSEFDIMMKDDAETLDRYPDVAVLQWVLKDRYWIRKSLLVSISYHLWGYVRDGARYMFSKRSLQAVREKWVSLFDRNTSITKSSTSDR